MFLRCSTRPGSSFTRTQLKCSHYPNILRQISTGRKSDNISTDSTVVTTRTGTSSQIFIKEKKCEVIGGLRNGNTQWSTHRRIFCTNAKLPTKESKNTSNSTTIVQKVCWIHMACIVRNMVILWPNILWDMTEKWMYRDQLISFSGPQSFYSNACFGCWNL